MDIEQFTEFGHRFVDWIADYYRNIESYPVLSPLGPGEVKRSSVAQLSRRRTTPNS